MVEVARPIVLTHDVERGGAEFHQRDFLGFGQLGHDLVNQKHNIVGLAAQGRNADGEGRERGQKLAVLIGVFRQLCQRAAAGADNAHIVALGFGEQKADALLDIFAVLGNIAQIKNAAAGFLQQIERNIYDMLGFAGLHPSGAVFVEIARHQFERRAGFAGEQHGGVLLGRALERAVELLNGGAVA